MDDMVNIHEAKTHLSRLLERVNAGETIVIAKAGQPVADLVPHVSRPVKFGSWVDKVTYDDAVFEGLDPDIQRMFYGDDAAS